MTARLAGLALVFVALGSIWVGAARADTLYEVEVAVASQGEGERASALRVALREMLVRLSGRQQLSGAGTLDDALDHPDRYVQQYGYRRVTTQGAHEAGPSTPWRLWVRFEPSALERLIADRGLALWGPERPSTLVWLAVQDGHRRYLVGSDSDEVLRTVLQDEARRRGMPLIFPLLDLEDQRRLGFADVWGGFLDAVRTASSRYAAEAILVARLYRHPDDGWSARWTFINEARPITWSSEVGELQPVVAGAVDRAADALVGRYAYRPGQGAQTQVSLQISGVEDVSDFARVNRYLAERSQIEALQVVEVDGARVRYRLAVVGQPEGLVRAFELGGVLVPAPEEVSQPGSRPLDVASSHRPIPRHLSYRLLP